MSTVPVFAGLGSDVLFSPSTSDQAASDVKSSHSQVLLETCHRIFISEISQASGSVPSSVDVQDFQRPQDLITPSPSYHDHPVVQHATLSVVQLLRYQSRNLNYPDYDVHKNAAVTGFCAGFLTAVAVATSCDSIQYLARASECFRLAVLIGIASEQSQRKLGPSHSKSPWSVIVGNIEQQDISELLTVHASEKASRTPLYISAINSPTCFTISGRGDDIDAFVKTKLPTKCRTKPTNLFILYHNRSLMTDAVEWIKQQYYSRQLSFPSRGNLLIPMISTANGTLINATTPSSTHDLVSVVLDLILGIHTDWPSVESTILSIADDRRKQGKPSLIVNNYGPGYGALSSRGDDMKHVAAEDVSLASSIPSYCDDDIAIIGVGVDLPNAPNPDILWQNIMQKLNSCTEIPNDRFHVEDYYAANGNKSINANRSMKTQYGNFLEDPFAFDNQLFGISPREAPSIDPQQRVILQTVYRALENAGYTPDSTPSFSRETFGCFIGNSTLDYIDNLRNSIDVYYSPGTLRAFLSGRISYVFKWSGPSLTIDTACSSSLACIHQAAQALVNGDCRAAVAGGVNIISSPEMYLGLDRAHFLSPSGQCKAFDESADGYCRSEGSAAFVLKKLSDAIQENDRILGVIKGIAMNQSGNATSITHPHSPTQESLFQRLLSRSKVDPNAISVVECHGTGTQAGDPNELRAIRRVLCRSRNLTNPLYVTSIKSNIGHLEAASGGASLAKLLLMLKHKRVPPQALLHTVNPAIQDLGVDGTVIVTESHDWATPFAKQRTCLLNNFGAAGSNVALLLQEYESPEQPRDDASDASNLYYTFGCSARTPALLEQVRSNILSHIAVNEHELRLKDICYTSTTRRSLDKFRLSMTASTLDGLAKQLEHAKVLEASDRPRPTVFVFSGQGSQYLGMGRDLMAMSPTFKAIIMRCHQLLTRWELPSCLNVIQCDPADDFPVRDSSSLQAFQVAIFAIEVALARMLQNYGLRPEVVIGHSLGEYAALAIAGVLAFEDGLWLVAKRAQLIVQNCKLWDSSMLGIGMGSAEVQQKFLNRAEFAEIEVACANSPSACVVGGQKEKILALRDAVKFELGKPATILDVPVAYHTAALDSVLEELEQVASELRLSPPKIAIASNVLGRVIMPGEEVIDAKYFVDHCRKSVAFDAGVADILKLFADSFTGRWIEIGPHPSLLPMLKTMLSHDHAKILPTLRRDRHPTQTVSELLTILYEQDVGCFNWRSSFEDLYGNCRMIDLPPVPMIRTRYYIPCARELPETPSPAASSTLQTTPFTVLMHRVIAADDAIMFETPIRQLAYLIEGHRVCGKPLCPASVYAEMAVAAVTMIVGIESREYTYKLSDTAFLRPLLYLPGSSDTVRIVLRPANPGIESWVYEVSTTSNSSQSKLHCTGSIRKRSISHDTSKLAIVQQALGRRKAIFDAGDYQTFTTKILYNRIFSRVVEYNATYQAVRKLFMDDDSKEIFAMCELPQDSTEAVYASNPVLLDTMLHVAGFAANLSVDNLDVCICSKVGSTTILRKGLKPGHSFEVHCSNYTLPSEPGHVIADAHAIDGEGLIAIIKGMQFQTLKLAKIQASFEFAARERATIQHQVDIPVPTAFPVTPDTSITLVADEPDFVNHINISPASSISLSSNQDTIFSVLSETTGVKTEAMTPRTDLAAMGVDSLMIFEIQEKLEQILGHKLKNAELLACRTVADMESLCSTRRTSAVATPAIEYAERHLERSSIGQVVLRDVISLRQALQDESKAESGAELDVPAHMVELLQKRLKFDERPEAIQQPTGNANSSPLYLVHPGAGMCHEYYRISTLGRAVYAFSDPRMFVRDREDDWASIEQMAEAYADKFDTNVNAQCERSAILGGYSFGGIVAFEAARLLLKRGQWSIKGVVLIDAPPPFGHIPLSEATITAAMQSKHIHLRRPRSKHAAEFEAAIGALACRNNLRSAARLKRYQPSRVGQMPRVILLRSSAGFEAVGKKLPDNPWLHDRTDVGTCVNAWEELLQQPVDVIDIPGDHFTPFEPDHVGGTSQAIHRACELLD